MNEQTTPQTIDLTPQSSKVAQAIYDLMDMNGIGPTINELSRETGLSHKVLRGNLSDLVQKDVVEVDPKALSGAKFDMYYHIEQMKELYD